MYSVLCRDCCSQVSEAAFVVACPLCAGPLDFSYSGQLSVDRPAGKSMWAFRDFLPIRRDSRIVSLGEGSTPLLRTRCHKNVEVYLKNETLNPTGSQKDRSLSIGVTKAVEFGCDTLMLYSDGSTALASAAYAACAGLRNITLVPPGAPDSRLLPLRVYNSIVLEYQGNPTAALDWVHEACQVLSIYETSTYRRANPYESEAPKTIGFEILEQLGRVPDWVVVPVGGGGTLAGIWKAFVDLEAWGLISKRPRMVGVLPEGYNMLELALHNEVKSEEELRALKPAHLPPTMQVKLAMPFPPDGVAAIEAIRYSDGCFTYATDSEAFEAQRKLGACEGVYSELSAAAAFVGVERILNEKKIQNDETVVALITGSGFRETGALSQRVTVERIPIYADSGLDVLQRILGR